MNLHNLNIEYMYVCICGRFYVYIYTHQKLNISQRLKWYFYYTIISDFKNTSTKVPISYRGPFIYHLAPYCFVIPFSNITKISSAKCGFLAVTFLSFPK